ncbi:IS1096 element passenger TnpR family protein [Roseimaritima sediminicola]|uniref:IS1096 element passenger TnpR family protein n=1 Tax=Roseimaritima sediminicola TaxID=2662066 RepID=UPI00129827EF|nr:GntR family transcriptional regulator [Roseimaritima sediminicola]
MPDFTPTQGKYLSYIHAYTVGFGLPPAESEIAKAIGVSAPSVHQMLKTLQRKALIHRERGVARSIKILADESTIPQWSGGTITRVETRWVSTRSQRRSARSTRLARSVARSNQRSTDLYVFKITLVGSKPPIWRRIETRDVSLARLHQLIQTAMGWTNSHLHQFRIGEQYYMDSRGADSDPDWVESYDGITVAKLVSQHGTKLKLRYEYDFGDGWEHNVVLEKITRPADGASYPRCTGGRRACPPEDVGGLWGFYEFVQAVNNPEHPEHEEKLEWYGDFDPAEFDKDEATAAMQIKLPSW